MKFSVCLKIFKMYSCYKRINAENKCWSNVVKQLLDINERNGYRKMYRPCKNIQNAHYLHRKWREGCTLALLAILASFKE